MRKRLFFLLCVMLCTVSVFTSCNSKDDDEDPEYENWQARNLVYFAGIRTAALDSIRQARNTYGTAWRDHCNWRTFLSYAMDSTITNESTDSIYVQILKRGTGAGCPLSTDSCRLFYRGKLIPSVSYPEGFVFTYSGQSSKYDEIFNTKTAVPTIMRPNSTVKGFGTALQNMHIGDLWRVYIPYSLGYDDSETSSIPAYSTLIFEVQLVSYYRSGSSVPSWN